jgi:lipopolysaccharide transport system permease protein
MHSRHWIIEQQKSIFKIDVKEIWAYRDLLLLLVHRDITSFYKQTVLGPLWLFVQPVLVSITYVLVFGKVAKLSTDGLPLPLFYLAGITFWNYFSECFNRTCNVLKDNANLFGKVYFPRLIIPLSIMISNQIKFGFQLLLFCLGLVVYQINGTIIHITPMIALLPLLVLFTGLQGIGMGLIVAASTVKYKDLLFLVGFGLQLLMYSTTVIYPLSSAAENIKWIIEINPMTAILEAFRYGFLGKGNVNFNSLMYSATCSISLFMLGTLIFNKTEKNFIDTI